MVTELVGSAREAAKGLAKFLADDERGGEVLIEDFHFHVLVSAMGALNSAADRIEALEAALAPFAKLGAEVMGLERKPDNKGVFGFNDNSVTYGDFRNAGLVRLARPI